MKRAIAVLLTLSALLVATAAFAVDFNTKAPLVGAEQVQGLTALLFCDNGTPSSAYFQDDNARYGNVFNFGGGSQVTTVEYLHHGFGFAGPYSYDLEFWDRTTCTLITAVNGLSAADAAGTVEVESENVCAEGIVLTGDVVVAVDANTCAVPTDCYPDVLFDTQVAVACPIIVDALGGVCIDVSGQSGPFLLRVTTDECPPVPTAPTSWGAVKQIYR